jgi:hypothetical protein
MVEDDRWHESGDEAYGYDELPLFGDWEVMVMGGREAYPAAIVTYNHVTSAVRVLVKNRDFHALHPNGVNQKTLEELSKRTYIERQELIKTTHQQLVEQFRAEGVSEGTALLKAGKEMERLGYYPKTPTITARLLSQSEEQTLSGTSSWPIFAITSEEMRSGIFQDIEQTISDPGTLVDKAFTPYVIHRDYKNEILSNVVGEAAYPWGHHRRFGTSSSVSTVGVVSIFENHFRMTGLEGSMKQRKPCSNSS